MAGTWLDSVAAAPNNWVRLKVVKAYEEGVVYRLGGNDVARPKANNPFPSGSPEETAWDEGWDDSKAGTIDGSSAYTGQTGPV